MNTTIRRSTTPRRSTTAWLPCSPPGLAWTTCHTCWFPAPVGREAGHRQANTDPWNKNIYAHRAEETLAQSDTVRAAALLRVISLGLAAVTVWCAYAMARLLWPEHPFLALGAASFVAFNPQFIALSIGVTNDNLLNALFGLSLLCMLRFMRDGADWPRWAALGGLVGLGLLTKQSGLLLLPLGLLAVAWQRGAGSLVAQAAGRRRRVPCGGAGGRRLVVRAQRNPVQRPSGPGGALYQPTLVDPLRPGRGG